MKIENQIINGGSQQFADKIINSNSEKLSQVDSGLLKLIYDNAKDEKEKGQLVEALTILKDTTKNDIEKEGAKSLWKNFLETGVGTLAEEAVKGLASPTFWAMLLN